MPPDLETSAAVSPRVNLVRGKRSSSWRRDALVPLGKGAARARRLQIQVRLQMRPE